MKFPRKKTATLIVLALSVLMITLTVPHLVQSPPNPHSSKVAYVTDASSGRFKGLSGNNIFDNAVGTSDGCSTHTSPCTYTTPAPSSTAATFTDLDVSAIGGVASLAPFDTVMLYIVCDIGSHPSFVDALNTYLATGLGKVVIYDGDWCSPGNGGTPDYSGFNPPFTTSNPGPRGASGTVTFVQTVTSPDTLTRGVSTGTVSSTDAVGDSNTFNAKAAGWCSAVEGTNVVGTTGIQVGFAKTPAGGLVIYNGEDNSFTFAANAWDKTLFDNILDQPQPGNIPCKAVPVSGQSSSVVVDICSGPPPVTALARPEKDFPCVTGNQGDEQGYAFGTTCFPTAANPCAFSSAKKIAITIAFSNPNPNLADFELNMLINNVQVTSANSDCTGTADFTLKTNRVCIDTGAVDFTGALNPAIHPGHCTATATPPCIAPNPEGVFTIVSSDSSIVSTVSNGVNTLTLDITSGQAISILGIQAIIEF